MNEIAEEILMHTGVARRSGRYPWGSGKKRYQHSGDFISRFEELVESGMRETDIAQEMEFINPKTGRSQTSKLRAQVSLAKNERRTLKAVQAQDLRDKGYSLNEIAAQMGYKNDSSVRALLNAGTAARATQAKQTADFLREMVDTKGMIDVGAGVERERGVSREKFEQAIHMLEMEGYVVHGGGIPQVTNNGRQINMKVLCPPGTENKEIFDFDKVHSLDEYVSHDGGTTFDKKWVYPKSMDSSRINVCYKEDGGIEKDGLVEIRRGVDDLSLGNSRYAQVRILVDGTHYIKGMAVYSDDMPDGADVVFNTNKAKGTPLTKVLKEIKDDPENPFGALIKNGVNDPDDPTSESFKGGQSYYIDKNGNKQLSLINKRAEEGDWGEWSDSLSSQFLSKQPMKLIERQLGLALADKQAEYDEIMSLTNPTVKKVLLQSFSDDCDSAAVHLRAAALPRQKYQVIVPIKSISDKEVYAPNFSDGEQVALVRYPHGGTFEIPVLTVNNKQPEGKRVLGSNPADAIGINSKVAEQLSGADFDGDTVMVIPANSKVKITSKRPLKQLEGFDAKMEYGYDTMTKDADGTKHYFRDGFEYKAMHNTQNEMGKISNLITDMTLRAAPNDEIARAVKHSMVVIDAEKHGLDYKKSEIVNDIATLKKTYQGHIGEDGKYHEGSATLISRSKSKLDVLKRKGSPKINTKDKSWYDPDKPEGALLWNSVEESYDSIRIKDPDTGKLRATTAPERTVYYDKLKSGEDVSNYRTKSNVRMQSSTKMAETSDARTLSSGTPQEEAYASYANSLKSLGNQARIAYVETPSNPMSATAKVTYKPECDKLMADLNVALKNAPREREAQRMANTVVKAKTQSNPDMTKKEIKKAEQQALTASRAKVGAQRTPVPITDRQWEAIQSGAISENKLLQVLNNADIDAVRQRAMPRATTQLSDAKINQIARLKQSGYTNDQIAQRMGVSTNTINKYKK